MNVREWSEKDESLKDWRFPLEFIDGAETRHEAGTKITITEVHEDIKALFADRTIESTLHRSIGQTYAPFLSRYVSIDLNGAHINAVPIPLGASKDFRPALETWEQDGVRITLMASVAARGAANEWKSELAGWYVICNGRITDRRSTPSLLKLKYQDLHAGNDCIWTEQCPVMTPGCRMNLRRALRK